MRRYRFIVGLFLLCALLEMPVLVLAETSLRLEPFSIKPGETKEVVIGLENEVEITAVQFDMLLPEGLTIATDADDELLIDIAGRTTLKRHALDASATGEGYRFLLASNRNLAIDGSAGALISVTLTAATDFSGGILTLTNIELVSPDESVMKPAAVSVEVTPSDATSMPAVTASSRRDAKTVYSLHGRQMSSVTPKGVCIVDGRKVFSPRNNH